MKKLKLIIASVLLTVFTLQLSAQKKDKKDDKKAEGPQNVIKLNVSQLVFTNLSFQYERAFHKNLSGALGISFLVPRDIPSTFYTAPTIGTSGFNLPKFGGWAITPEFRFYPGEKIEHQAPHGFYLAPYFRYARYNLRATYTDIGIDGSTGLPFNNSFDMTASYYGFTAGLMIGSQWVLGKHFSIDWWILGFGAGAAKFSIETIATTPLNLTAAQQAQLNTDIRGNVGGLGTFGSGAVDVTTTSNSAKVVVSGLPMRSLRGFGLTLGFVF